MNIDTYVLAKFENTMFDGFYMTLALLTPGFLKYAVVP
jgi:hypothetical protein